MIGFIFRLNQVLCGLSRARARRVSNSGFLPFNILIYIWRGELERVLDYFDPGLCFF